MADQKNGRVEEFSPSGKYIAEFGKGQLSHPYGIAVDAAGNVWVSDLASTKLQVDEYSETEKTFKLTKEIGKKATCTGEFAEPEFIAFSGGNLYVTDTANNRVEEFSSSGTCIAEFGSKGTGNGQFEGPEGIASDPATGTLYVADTGKSRIEAFSANGAFLAAYGVAGTGEGQFKFPVGLAFNATGTLYVDDYSNNRIVKAAAPNVQNEPPAPPQVGTTAVTTIDYKVPVAGAGAPYAMGESEVAAWAQEDDPVEATAIFPPDEIQTTPASDYRRATLVYLDKAGHTVNVASPGGAITTTEYNEDNAAVRQLSAANRATALAESKSAEVSKKLDSQTIYNEEGTEIEETLGPEHSVKLASGSVVQARARAVYSYDEGAPSEGGPYRLVTKTTEGAKYSGGEADVRTKTISYSGQSNLGWKLRKPTSTTIDPSGLKLTSTTIYDPTTGNVLETRSPGAGTAKGPVGGYVDTMQLNTVTASVGQPGGVAIDSKGNVWQVETSANRVDEYSSTGEFIRTFGTEGTTSGKFKKPQGIAIDASKNVWVTDTGNNRVEGFSSTGAFLYEFGLPGETTGKLKEPTGIAIDSSGNVWVADRGNNRVQKFAPSGEFKQAIGKSGFENGQFMTYESGTTYQMWLAFDSGGHLWVTDGGNNRVQEFSSSGTYMSKFGNAFGEVSSENGKFANPAGIAVDSSGNLWVVDSGHSRVQEISSSGTFITKFGENGTAPGQLSAPTGIAVDSSGRLWVGDTVNNRSQQFGLAKADPRVAQMIYYSSAANATYPECGEHVEWANLVCRTQPAVQPVASVAPKLPVTTVTYNLWDGVESTVETVGTTTRTKSSSFDAAGRLTGSSISSSVGTAVPTVTREYSTTTGALVKLSTTVSEKTQSVTETFNTLGQLTSYQDADGNTASFKYTLDGQLEEANDGKGVQSYAYDATTGALSKLVDTAAGTFTAERDLEGRIVSEGYPNGMSAKYTYDPTGAATALEYVKTTHCTEKCTWYSQSLALGIHGEMLSQANTLASDAYVYDAAGQRALRHRREVSVHA